MNPRIPKLPLLFFTLSSLLFASAPAPSHATAQLTWRSAIGTHYRLMPDARMGTVRSFPTPSKLSFLPDVTNLAPADKLPPTTGHFSREPRYYDFENKLNRDKIGHDYGKHLDEAIAARTDLIWNIGQIHASQKDHVALVMAKNGAYYKDLVYAAVAYTNTGRFADSPIEVYWEIGNEINSWRRFGLRDLGEIAANSEHARDYVEYYLAPAVEAIRAASLDTRGNPRAVKILLGNVTFLRNPDTRRFLAAILDRTVEGAHAPTLAGQKVSDLVDAIGIHYSTGEHKILQAYYDEWIASGKVPGMWNTEELGHAGLGDFDIARISFRWLDFWARRNWTPDTARLQFWGDQDYATRRERSDGLNAKTTGEIMERHLGQFLQDFPLAALDAEKDYAIKSTQPHETHAFVARKNISTRRVALLVLPSEKTANISEIIFQNLTGKITAAAFIQPISTTLRQVAVTAKTDAGNLRLTFENLALTNQDALLVELEIAETATAMKLGVKYAQRKDKEPSDLKLLAENRLTGIRLSAPPVLISEGEKHFAAMSAILGSLPKTIRRELITLDLRPFTVPGRLDKQFRPDWHPRNQHGEIVLQQTFRNFTLNNPQLAARWTNYIREFSQTLINRAPALAEPPVVSVNNELSMAPRGTIVRVPAGSVNFNSEFARLHHGYKRLVPFNRPDMDLAGNFAPGFHLTDYSENTQKIFREWLIARHGGLAQLNKTLSTNFKTATGIAAPKPEQGPSPLWFEWLNFRFDNFQDFFRLVRNNLSDKLPLSHNFVAVRYTLADPFSAVDPWQLAETLDIMGVDYPDLFDLHVLSATSRRALIPEASIGYNAAFMFRETLLAAAGGSYMTCFWHTSIDFINTRKNAWSGVEAARPFVEKIGGSLSNDSVAVLYLRDAAFAACDPLEIIKAWTPTETKTDTANQLEAVTRLVSGGDKSFPAAGYLSQVTSAWALLMESGYHPAVTNANTDARALLIPEAPAIADGTLSQIENHDGPVIATGAGWGARNQFQQQRDKLPLPKKFGATRTGLGQDAVLADGTKIPGPFAILEPAANATVLLRDNQGRALAVKTAGALYIGFSLPQIPFFSTDGLQRERLDIRALNDPVAQLAQKIIRDFLTENKIAPAAEITGEKPAGLWSTLLDDGDRWHLVLIDYADWCKTWETIFNPEFCEPIEGFTQPRCYQIKPPHTEEIFRPKQKTFDLAFALPTSCRADSAESFGDENRQLKKFPAQLKRQPDGRWTTRVEKMEFIRILTFPKSAP